MQQVMLTESTALNKGQVGFVKLLHVYSSAVHNTAQTGKKGRNSIISDQAHVRSSESTMSASGARTAIAVLVTGCAGHWVC